MYFLWGLLWRRRGLEREARILRSYVDTGELLESLTSGAGDDPNEKSTGVLIRWSDIQKCETKKVAESSCDYDPCRISTGHHFCMKY